MYTIKSTSEDGVYYLVKDWRKNKAIWTTKNELDRTMLYKRPQDAWASLTKLLKVMNEYKTDTFELVTIEDKVIYGHND